ncbi:hypothetical protein [Pseudarthrobacter sp. LT1]|uniref:hypothetical protein n=1 Tax=Pseudarthrobacter sp. LT1 TaxID=3111450 RepID=UPI002D779277|nr:hypothetical protein [Pseudarthrobacter sp. LT1]WRT16153.1 hypothetical protein VIK36_21950 [Pseudarthrobacter sp. LT1]
MYAAATDVMGVEVRKKDRIQLWSRIADEQALSLIAQILTDIDISTTADADTEVDQRWIASIVHPEIRTRLSIASTLGDKMFAPQLLLLAAGEALSYCPPGPPTDTTDGLDALICCLLGIGDESGAGDPAGETWGGVNAELAGEIIANLHFNKSMWVGHQLSWIERTWFQDWPKRTPTTDAVGGEPRDLFKEATGVELADFAAVAFNVYAQAALHKFVRFPSKFFDTLGLPPAATEHFLSATSRTVPELRAQIQKDITTSGGSRYAFNTFRRFPLVQLASGEFLVLSPNFVIQRALSEVTFFDVRHHLKAFDKKHGTKRDEAFHQCTTDILEHETGVTLRRIFSRAKVQVLDEIHLQRRFGSRRHMPKICDYAVRVGKTWLLFEVTDTPIPVPVVFAKANADDLDSELDRVLTKRKAKQLASTISLLQQAEPDRQGQSRPGQLTFIPLVVTAQTGLPWNPTVHHRVIERLSSMPELSQESCAPVALITSKDLMILENAASLGYDVVDLLRSWRQTDPGNPLDQHLHQRGVPLSSPRWEKEQAVKTINNFMKRMQANSDH